MELPKVNLRIQKSRKNQNHLEMELFDAIRKFEQENHYTFLTYEIDNVLLNMIKQNHEFYLRAEFGDDLI